jgi:hypothetical protein
VLAERRAQGLRVVEEYVDPDPWVRTGDARRVAQRAPRGREGVVALDPRGAGLVEDDVREHVREVRRHRHEPVVCARVDGDGLCPE